MNRWSAWQPCASPCLPGDLSRARWCSPAGFACGFHLGILRPVIDVEAAIDASELAYRLKLANARVATRLAELRFHAKAKRRPRP